MCALRWECNSALFSSRTYIRYHVFYMMSSFLLYYFLYIFLRPANTTLCMDLYDYVILSINKEVTSMTILNCSATKCIYNDNRLCSSGDIEITGDNVQMKQAAEASATVRQLPCKTAVPNTAAAKRSTSTAKHRNAPTTTNVTAPPLPLM